MKSHKFTLPLALIALLLFILPAHAQQIPVLYLFWGDGCPHCATAKPILRELATQYNIELREYEIWYNEENQALLQKVAAVLGFKPRVVPTIILGNQYWEGYDESIRADIEAAIKTCLANGCPDQGAAFLPESSPESSNTPTTANAQTIARNNGFALAIFTLVALAAALIYSAVSVAVGKTFSLPGWTDWLILILIVVGIAVAGYLSYVETQSVEAFCGPVGDCNAVQASPYSKLFGVLPVGVLGLLGYFALLAAWLVGKFKPHLQKTAALTFWGMAMFAVAFSTYLTYLEPFVIRAVCAWCITSAWIVLFLLLLATPGAVNYLRPQKKSTHPYKRKRAK